MKILNIVVCYKNEEEVLEYLKQLENQTFSLTTENELVVVIVINERSVIDNNEFEPNAKSVYFNSIIYQAQTNLGYLNGMLFGYNKYVNENEHPDWTVLSNTDLKYNDTKFFEKFSRNRYSTDISVVGPCIYKPDTNSYDNPVCINRRKKNKINRLIFIFSFKPLANLYFRLSGLKNKNRSKNLQSQLVYEVHGAYFFVKDDLMRILQIHKFGAFLFSEEAYIAEMALLNNKKVYYDSTIEIVHDEHSITSRLHSKVKNRYYIESLIYIRNVFYKRTKKKDDL